MFPTLEELLKAAGQPPSGVGGPNAKFGVGGPFVPQAKPQGQGDALSAILGAAPTSTGFGALEAEFGPQATAQSAPLPKGELFQVPKEGAFGKKDAQAGQLVPLGGGSLPKAPVMDMPPLSVQGPPPAVSGGPAPGGIAGLLGSAPKFEPTFVNSGLPGNLTPMFVNNPAEEAMARQAAAFNMAQSQVMGAGHPWNPMSGPTPFESAQIRDLSQQIGGAATQVSDQSFRGGQGNLERANRMSLQGLQNTGALGVADIQSRSHQLGELDKAELHIRDAHGKGQIDPVTAQAMIDTVNARRANLAGGGSAGPAGTAAAGGPPGVNPMLSPPIKAGADLNVTRNLLGAVDEKGGFALDPNKIPGFFDSLTPAQIPQVAAAINSGQLGPRNQLMDALYQSAGRNYQLATGAGAGQQSSPTDLSTTLLGANYGGGEGVAPKQLFQIGRVPASTIVGRFGRGVPEAASGSFFNKVVTPDGRMLDLAGAMNPFGAVNTGQSLTDAKRRTPLMMSLLAELQKTQPQPQPPR